MALRGGCMPGLPLGTPAAAAVAGVAVLVVEVRGQDGDAGECREPVAAAACCMAKRCCCCWYRCCCSSCCCCKESRPGALRGPAGLVEGLVRACCAASSCGETCSSSCSGGCCACCGWACCGRGGRPCADALCRARGLPELVPGRPPIWHASSCCCCGGSCICSDDVCGCCG